MCRTNPRSSRRQRRRGSTGGGLTVSFVDVRSPSLQHCSTMIGLVLALALSPSSVVSTETVRRREQATANGESKVQQQQQRGLQPDDDDDEVETTVPSFSPTLSPERSAMTPSTSTFGGVNTDATPGLAIPIIVNKPPTSNPTPAPQPTPQQPPPLFTTNNNNYLPASQININNYCGREWADAYNTCYLPCPNGVDTECAPLGEGFACQSFTACHERLMSGTIVATVPEGAVVATDEPTDEPTPLPTPNPTPAPQKTMTQTASTVMIPICPSTYSQSTDYTFGSMIALPIEWSDTMQEVYQCGGEHCNAGPGVAPGSENGHLTWDLVGLCGGGVGVLGDSVVGPTVPSVGGGGAVADDNNNSGLDPKWYPSVASTFPDCSYGTDYPAKWAEIEFLSEQYLFETEEDCCASSEDLCNPEAVVDNTAVGNSNGVPAGASEGVPTMAPVKASAAPTEVPTAMPVEEEYETYMPTASSGVLMFGGDRWGMMFGIMVMIFVAPFI